MAAGRRGRNKKAGPKSKSKWKDEYIDLIPELILQGASITKIAKILKITRETIYEWKRQNKSFSDKLTTAQDDYNSGKVENSLLRRSLGYRYTETTQERDKDGNLVPTKKVRKHVVPDTGAITFYLKNRKPDRWKDKHEVEGGLTILNPEKVSKPSNSGV